MPSQTPNVFTFPRQEPGTQGHLDLVEPLRSLPDALAAALSGITDEQARFTSEDGGWCIKEIAGHMRDSCEINHQRLYMMSTQTDPVLDDYDGAVLVRERKYAQRDLDEIVAGLRESRDATVRLLTTLVNWNWARTGQFAGDGRLSIRQKVDDMIRHEAQHLEDIRRLRALAEAASE